MKKYINERTMALIGFVVATALLVLAMLGVVPLELGALICEIGIICFSVWDIITGKDRTRGYLLLALWLCRVVSRIVR